MTTNKQIERADAATAKQNAISTIAMTMRPGDFTLTERREIADATIGAFLTRIGYQDLADLFLLAKQPAPNVRGWTPMDPPGQRKYQD